MSNKLFFGDNLQVLREHVVDRSVDLVYLDPPFNSDMRYNVLFETDHDKRRTAQAEAFRDTWFWDQEAESAFGDIARIGGPLALFVNALYGALGRSDLMAYLVMMAVRLHELRRVLKTTGSLYLHCDPTASHYLKIMLDGIFGAERFRNEIVWKRTGTHSDSKTWSRVSDSILFYTAGREFCWNTPREAYSKEYLSDKYRHHDGDGRLYQLDNMTSPSPRPNMMYEWKGFPFPAKGWRYEKTTMAKLDAQGRLWYPTKMDGSYDPTRRPRLKRYLDEMEGGVMGNVWTDIAPLNSQAKERLGYPTQKPLALLSRIISASTNPDDTVLDPFCGCGTSVHAAAVSGRAWIGIDVAYHAIEIIADRLHQTLDLKEGRDFAIDGRPNDFASAVKLAERDKYQFQWWANYLVGVQQLREIKKGRDGGVDGEIFFPAGPGRGFGRILTSVKGGHSVGSAEVRDFRGALEREGADGGLFICLRRPTRDMTQNAASAGFFSVGAEQYPRLQIVSLEAWFLDNDRPSIPSTAHLARRPNAAPVAKARRAADGRQIEMKLPLTGGSGKGEKVHWNPRTTFELGEDEARAV